VPAGALWDNGSVTHAPDEPQQPHEAVSPDAPEQPVVGDGPRGDAAEEAEGTATHDEVTVRRAPKFSVFLLTGGALGVLVSFILTSLFPFDPSAGVASTYGYFALWGVTFGAALGAVVAIVVDRVSLRRARTLQAERRRVDAPEPPAVEGELE
jgi:hypothetical protein